MPRQGNVAAPPPTRPRPPVRPRVAGSSSPLVPASISGCSASHSFAAATWAEISGGTPPTRSATSPPDVAGSSSPAIRHRHRYRTRVGTARVVVIRSTQRPTRGARCLIDHRRRRVTVRGAPTWQRSGRSRRWSDDCRADTDGRRGAPRTGRATHGRPSRSTVAIRG